MVAMAVVAAGAKGYRAAAGDGVRPGEGQARAYCVQGRRTAHVNQAVVLRRHGNGGQDGKDCKSNEKFQRGHRPLRMLHWFRLPA